MANATYLIEDIVERVWTIDGEAYKDKIGLGV